MNYSELADKLERLIPDPLTHDAITYEAGIEIVNALQDNRSVVLSALRKQAAISDRDIDDLIVIRQKLWQAVTNLTTISSKDYSQRMSGANGIIRSALEHVERISRRMSAPPEEINFVRDALRVIEIGNKE
jgi:hypothetical protein